MLLYSRDQPDYFVWTLLPNNDATFWEGMPRANITEQSEQNI